MKFAVISLAAALAVGGSSAYAQASASKGGHAHAAAEPAPCCDTTTKTYKARGIVKKTDAARSSVTIAHGPVKDLNWPAMTMAFKVKDKALLDKLAADKKVEISFVQEGKDYVVTAVQ